MKQSNLEIIRALFDAGQVRQWSFTGSYFELLECPDPVDVLLTDRNGATRGLLLNADETFFVQNTDFETVQITSATVQTIRFAYGTGEAGTRRTAGSVSLSNQSGPFTHDRTSVGSGAAVQIRPQNTARRRLLVQNNTAAQNLRVTLDGSAPTAANGLRLIPGDLLDLTDYCPTGEIRAIFESGAAADVEWAEG